jgi:hypothetical protein
MRRARLALALAILSLAFCAPGAVRAAQSVTRMNSIGLLDYTRKPTFKVGDWVRYKVTSLDENGNETDHYNLTVLIAGQDIWWGERCFYVETQTEGGGKGVSAVASLMSYAIFDDSLPEANMQSYMRKTVLGYDSDKQSLIEVLVAPKPSALTSRSTLSRPYSVKRDTLGADTVSTPLGLLHAEKTTLHRAWGNTGGSGDSTVYKEITEDRTQWFANEVPITRLAHEETWSHESRRSWLIGRSQEGRPALVVGGSGVVARVIGYGHGLASKMLPADRVHTFEQLEAAKKPAAAGAHKPAKTAKPAPKR